MPIFKPLLNQTKHHDVANTRQVNNLQELQFWSMQDVQYMAYALALANQGADSDEVPVGAVLVCDNQILGEGFNQPINLCDPTAHAEIVALRNACLNINNYRLPAGSTLYVTLEPCTMCVGALIHARVARIVFATHEPRAGMMGSQLNLVEQTCYNHKIAVASGLLQSESQQLLKRFFKHRRRQNKSKKMSQKT